LDSLGAGRYWLSMRLLIIQHDTNKGLGLFEGPFREAGLELDTRLAGGDPLTLDDHAGVVVLPGLADPIDDTEAVARTRNILREALERRLPTLGICLGAELLAEAAGAATVPCVPEFGFHGVTLDPAADHDALLSGLPDSVVVFHAHTFACELPAGAVALAHSESGLQAFRLGDRAWGIQFHPEPTMEMLDDWVVAVGPVMRRAGVDPAIVGRDARTHLPPWLTWTPRIAARFSGAVHSSAR
jgi:GMP synthase (glutamine-hydrolysing)